MNKPLSHPRILMAPRNRGRHGCRVDAALVVILALAVRLANPLFAAVETAPTSAANTTTNTNAKARPSATVSASTNTVAEDSRPRSRSPNRETTSPSKAQGFDAFKLVYNRNVFDPNRRPSVGPGRPPPKPKKVDGLALVGTMVYDKAAYAFFKGSEAQFQRALTVSNTIGGLKLIAITADGVKLCSASNAIIELTLDKQLKRDDDGEWQLSSSAVAFENADGSSLAGGSSTERSPTASSVIKSGAGADDIIKRLMQKREQEMNR
jgi:hypothetical protein